MVIFFFVLSDELGEKKGRIRNVWHRDRNRFIEVLRVMIDAPWDPVNPSNTPHRSIGNRVTWARHFQKTKTFRDCW